MSQFQRTGKRDRGGDERQGGGAGRIDALGHNSNTNREVAKWEKQCRDRLKRVGGEILQGHLLSKVTPPREMVVPNGALDIQIYLQDEGPIYAKPELSEQQKQTTLAASWSKCQRRGPEPWTCSECGYRHELDEAIFLACGGCNALKEG